MYYFDLVKSVDLGKTWFTDRYLHCCFNIYKRNDKSIKAYNGVDVENRLCLNKRPVYELPDEVIVGRYMKKTQEPNFEPDLCIGGWGVGCFGKLYNKKETSNQIWIKSNNSELLYFIENYNWRKHLNNISSAFLSTTTFKKIILEEFYKKL